MPGASERGRWLLPFLGGLALGGGKLRRAALSLEEAEGSCVLTGPAAALVLDYLDAPAGKLLLMGAQGDFAALSLFSGENAVLQGVRPMSPGAAAPNALLCVTMGLRAGQVVLSAAAQLVRSSPEGETVSYAATDCLELVMEMAALGQIELALAETGGD